MPKFNVHLYPSIRVLVKEIEAETQEKAIEKALETLNGDFIERHLRQPSEDHITIHDAEECKSAYVDIVGDEFFSESKEYAYNKSGWVED